jgi:hypothetical protein
LGILAEKETARCFDRFLSVANPLLRTTEQSTAGFRKQQYAFRFLDPFVWFCLVRGSVSRTRIDCITIGDTIPGNRSSTLRATKRKILEFFLLQKIFEKSLQSSHRTPYDSSASSTFGNDEWFIQRFRFIDWIYPPKGVFSWPH